MSEELQKQLIGSVQLGRTKAGKQVAHLFSTDKRLEFPVLTLFDLSMLEMVDIDPNGLDADPVYRRFWAYYVNSEKETSKGNPYRDVQYLEPVASDGQEPVVSVDFSQVLGELKAIRALVEILVTNQHTNPPKRIPRSVDMGYGDENADWIADQATREEELAIHDQIQAQHEASEPEGSALDGYFPRNGGEPELPAGEQALAEEVDRIVASIKGGDSLEIPTTGGNDMCSYLARAFPAVQCQGVGHLAYVMKKARPDWPGWPVTGDLEGWTEVAQTWADYWQALT